MNMKPRDITPCAACGKGVMHTGLPLLWRITAERYGIDAAAVQRRAGFEMMMGGGQQGAALAEALHTNEDIAKRIGDPITLILCEPCALDQHVIMRAWEAQS